MFEFSFLLLSLVDLLLLALVELFLLFQTFLDADAHLVFILGLFVADLVGLWSFEVVADVLGGAKLAAYFDLLLHLFSLVLDADGALVILDSCQS